MNAHKFVAEKGIKEAKAVFMGAPPSATHFNQNSLGGHYAKEVLFKRDFRWAWYNKINQSWYYDFAEHNHFELSELKQVVDSIEIVKEKGGLTLTKGLLDLGKHLADWMEKGSEKMPPNKPDKTNLIRCEKAIADYESIYGGEHV